MSKTKSKQERVRDAVRRLAKDERAYRDLMELYRRARRETDKVPYRTIVESSLDGVWLIDANGVTQYVNRSLAAMLDMRTDMLVGRHYLELFAPRNRPSMNRTRAMWTQGITEHRELHLLQADGSELPIRLAIRPLRGRHGNGQGALLRVTDLTASLKAKEALRRSEERYRTLVESAGDSFFLVNRQATVQDVNLTACDRLGYSRSTLIGMSLANIDTTFDADGWWKVWSSIDPREGLTEERIYRSSDGQTFPVETRLALIETQGEDFVLILARDVTARRAAQERLQRTEALLKTALAECPAGILVAGMPGRVQMANRAALALRGEDEEPLIGMELADLPARWGLHAADGSPLDPQDVPLARATRGETVRDVDMMVHRHDGDHRIAVANAAPLTTDDGQPLGGVMVLQDVTQRRSLERQLQQSRQLERIGRLAGGIAHDFNNLLTVVRGHAAILKTHSEEDVAGPADEIAAAANRAADLVRQLLAFARKDAATPHPLDLNTRIRSLHPMLGSLMDSAIELQLDLCDQPSTIVADGVQVEQVVMNLVLNSRDAIPEGGRITVRTECITVDTKLAAYLHMEPGRFVRLTVADNGEGMSAQTREHAFDPFYTTKEVGEGVGLGLSTVYGIMREAGGMVRIDSEPEEGCTVEVYWPWHESAVLPSAPKAPRPVEPTTAKAESILLVEDDPPVRRLVERTLRKQGYRVVVAHDGEHAIERFAEIEGKIDLLVTDVVMPKMGGPLLARILRDKHPSLRVLFMSGYAVQLSPETHTDDYSSYIAKPYSPADLLGRIREVLDTIEA